MKHYIKHIISVAVVMCLTISSITANAAGKEDEVRESSLIVNYDSGRLTVKGVEEHTRVEVSNMLGVKVYTAVTTQDKTDFNIFLRKGLYIVRVGAEVKRIVVK
ncbi:MAG: T9SS type A sorting domain-containing protein [Paludibacteraceae bacterium]|nr:T9SS type A sorting domain-containing protein [Paludibacteraceae bacterium]